MNESPRSAWREPMVWLVIALPLASVIAGVSLVVIAARSGGTDAVIDKVDRVSQIQTTDLGPDQRARQMDISVVLRVDRDALEVIPVTGELDRKAPLELQLLHPTLKEQDRQLSLLPGGLGWRVTVPDLDLGHDWRLQITPKNGEWRIKGRLPKDQHAARLAPVIAESDGT